MFMDQTTQQNLTDKNSWSAQASLIRNRAETLYNTMKDFISNPTWDQYKLINSALATFHSKRMHR